MKSVLGGVKVSWFEILKARGAGKFYSARTTTLKVGVTDQHFRKKRQLHEARRILAALPGAERREGVQHTRIISHMACRDGEQRSAVLQQYFIAQRWGKSW